MIDALDIRIPKPPLAPKLFCMFMQGFRQATSSMGRSDILKIKIKFAGSSDGHFTNTCASLYVELSACFVHLFLRRHVRGNI